MAATMPANVPVAVRAAAAATPTVYFSDMPPNWLAEPDSLGLACLGITIILAVFSIVVVSLRVWARLTTNAFGVDDGAMVVATALFITGSIFCILDIFAGLGSHIEKYLANEWNAPAIIMYLLLWQVVYAWQLPFIKCAICLSLFRITTEKSYRIALWMIMVLATISAMIGFIAVVITCQPIAKNWDPVLQRADLDIGWCLNYDIIKGISYYISASSIITDWACAVLPCFIVWNLQMRRRLKLSVAGILALGAVASVTTFVRLPYLGAYTAVDDTYYKVCNIVLWSQIECGIGIIAGSLPPLRRLLKGAMSSGKDSSYAQAITAGSGNRLASGKAGGASRTRSRAAKMAGSFASRAHTDTRCLADSGTPQGEGMWIELDDADSQKRILTRTKVEVQTESRAKEGSHRCTTADSNMI